MGDGSGRCSGASHKAVGAGRLRNVVSPDTEAHRGATAQGRHRPLPSWLGVHGDEEITLIERLMDYEHFARLCR